MVEKRDSYKGITNTLIYFPSLFIIQTTTNHEKRKSYKSERISHFFPFLTSLPNLFILMYLNEKV